MSLTLLGAGPSAGGALGIVTEGLVLNLDAGNTSSYSGTGTDWFDLSPEDNDGTLINGPTFDSANGGSIVFDGTDDHAYFSSAISQTMNTVNIWVNMRATSACPIVLYGQDVFSSFNWSWGIAVYPNNTHGFNEDPQTYPTTSLYTESVDTSIWKNFTLVRNNGGDVQLYKNAVLKGTKVGGGNTSLYDISDRLRIAKTGSTYGNFDLSIVHIYNRNLSADEIDQNYNALKSRFGL